MRTDEERQKLYLDLQSVQRKIALLNLSCSHSQHAESALNQTLEPVSETAEDFYGNNAVVAFRYSYCAVLHQWILIFVRLPRIFLAPCLCLFPSFS